MTKNLSYDLSISPQSPIRLIPYPSELGNKTTQKKDQENSRNNYERSKGESCAKKMKFS